MSDCRFLPFTMILMWNSKQKSFECFSQVCIFMAISQLRLKQLKSLKRKFTSLSCLKRSSPLKYLSPDLYAIPNSVFSTCLHAYEFCYLIPIHHMERGTSDWPFCLQRASPQEVEVCSRIRKATNTTVVATCDFFMKNVINQICLKVLFFSNRNRKKPERPNKPRSFDLDKKKTTKKRHI